MQSSCRFGFVLPHEFHQVSEPTSGMFINYFTWIIFLFEMGAANHFKEFFLISHQVWIHDFDWWQYSESVELGVNSAINYHIIDLI
jgi:hypothetical protein